MHILFVAAAASREYIRPPLSGGEKHGARRGRKLESSARRKGENCEGRREVREASYG